MLIYPGLHDNLESFLLISLTKETLEISDRAQNIGSAFFQNELPWLIFLLHA